MMFYLLLELPAFRQLTVTRAEWARGIEETLASLLSRYQIEETERLEEYRLYRVRPLSQSTVQELLRFLSDLQETLEEVREDLMGYTMLLDIEEGGLPREILRRLKATIMAVAFEDGIWVTRDAGEQLKNASILEPEVGTDLLRMKSITVPRSKEQLPIEDFVFELGATEHLMSFLESDGDQPAGRTLFLHDHTDGLLPWAATAVLSREHRAWLEIAPAALEGPRLSLDGAPAIDARSLSPEGEQELRRFERSVTEFIYADRSRSYPDNPRAQKLDLWHEALLLLKMLHPEPVVLCIDADRWGPDSLETLRELLAQTDPEGEITVAFLGGRETPLLSSFSEQVEVGHWEPEEVSSYEEFLAARRSGTPGEPEKASDGVTAFLRGCDDRELLLLALLEDYAPYISPERLEILAGRLALSPVEYRHRVAGLLADGALWSRPDGNLLVSPRLRGRVSAEVDLGTKNLVTRLVGVELLHLSDKGELEQRTELFSAMVFAAGEQQQELLLRDYLWERLPEFDGERMEQLLFGFTALRRDRLQRLAGVFRWRSSLYRGATAETFPLRENGSGGLLEAEYTLAVAEAHYLEGLLEKSLHTTKRAVTQFSQLTDDHGLARSYLQIALVSLGRGDINDGTAYLNYAVETAGAAKRGDVQLVGELLRRLVSFVWGNLTRVIQEAPELSTRANRFRRSEWELFAHFLYGKALLELGRFEEAERAFAAVYRRAETLGTKDVAGVALRWGRRAYSLSPESHPRDSLLPEDPDDQSSEGVLFELERSFLTGEESFLLEAEQEPRSPEKSGGFHPLYRLSWANGFASFEDLLLLPRRSTLDNLLYALTAWFRGRRGNEALARERLRWLTREAQLSPVDPWRPLYYYLYSDVLPRENSADTEDRRTVLGKSVKLAQERSARFDRTADKERYLMANPWNKLLMKEAKLINML